jgi:hypothetical protein
MSDHHELGHEERRFYRVVGEVLHYIWDPIGVAGVPQARDEYDGYVPQVFALLRSGAIEAEISEHLQLLSEDRMGMSRLAERANEAASVLVDWRDHFSESHA